MAPADGASYPAASIRSLVNRLTPGFTSSSHIDSGRGAGQAADGISAGPKRRGARVETWHGSVASTRAAGAGAAPEGQGHAAPRDGRTVHQRSGSTEIPKHLVI